MKRTWMSLALTLVWAGAACWAATGSVTPSQPHLVISQGSLGSVTISWTTSGCATAELYVSTDGGAESLVARSANGSVSPGWIQPERIYVFTLYAETSHTTLLDWTSVTSHVPPASNLGFNYWPEDNNCEILMDANWTTANKDIVKRDLDHMSSLSGTVLRMMFWTNKSGYDLAGEDQGGSFNQTKLTDISENFIDFLQYCDERDLKVCVAFGNLWHTVYRSASSEYYWQWAYGNTDTGFNNHISDSLYWMNTFIDEIESSAYADTVIYYDLQNEISSVRDRGMEFLTRIYDGCNVPKGKFGISPLIIASDAQNVYNALGARRMDWVEFHTYPTGNNNNPTSALSTLDTYFSDSTIVIGEFGARAYDQTDEDDQEDWVLDVSEFAINNDVPYFMHWGFWDNAPPNPDQVFGFGYSYDDPKDIMGSLSDYLNLAANPDFEIDNGSGQPQSWFAGGHVPVTFTRLTPGTGKITNAAHARLHVNGYSSGDIWMGSYLIPVVGGDELFVNAYIRSNMVDVGIFIQEHDSLGNSLGRTYAPVFTPSTWKPYNYLAEIGTWSMTLDPDTVEVMLCFIAGCDGDTNNYLDVDAVSLWTR